MIYTTSGEFIQALKDYKTYIKMAEEFKEKYRDLHYQRYEKVRSPLDYDIVGYKKGEPIRQIKRGGSYNAETIRAFQEKLDAEIDYVLDEYSKLIVKAQNVKDELNRIKEPLRGVIVMRYLEHKKLKEVCKKSGLFLEESGMSKYIQRELNKYYE